MPRRRNERARGGVDKGARAENVRVVVRLRPMSEVRRRWTRWVHVFVLQHTARRMCTRDRMLGRARGPAWHTPQSEELRGARPTAQRVPSFSLSLSLSLSVFFLFSHENHSR